MEYQVTLSSKEISFDVRADEDDVMDKLAFVHLVAMKFYGDEVEASTWKNGKKQVIVVKLRFKDWENCSEAKAHCDRNLKLGGVAPDYQGALDKADPGRFMARRIKKRAETK